MSLTVESLASLGITREDIITRAAEMIMEPDDGESVRANIINTVKRELAVNMAKLAESKIDQLLTDTVSGLIDSPFTPVDEWGEPKDKVTSLREMVKRKSLEFLVEKVGSDGKPGYKANMSRASYLAKKAAEDAMTYEVKKEIGDAVASAKTQMRKLVADYITSILINTK